MTLHDLVIAAAGLVFLTATGGHAPRIALTRAARSLDRARQYLGTQRAAAG